MIELQSVLPKDSNIVLVTEPKVNFRRYINVDKTAYCHKTSPTAAWRLQDIGKNSPNPNPTNYSDTRFNLADFNFALKCSAKGFLKIFQYRYDWLKLFRGIVKK